MSTNIHTIFNIHTMFIELFYIFLHINKKSVYLHNVKVLCDVAVSRHFTFNLIQMFNQALTLNFALHPPYCKARVTCRFIFKL